MAGGRLEEDSVENSEHTTPDLTPEPADTSAPSASETGVDETGPDETHVDGARKDPDTPRLIALLGSGLLVVILIAVVVWFAISTSALARENAIKDVAGAYLTAIADADADDALGKLAERPANTALLTRDVLEASRRTTPLTDIEITAVDQDGAEATAGATYRLGDERVSTRLRLVGDGRTAWKIAGVRRR